MNDYPMTHEAFALLDTQYEAFSKDFNYGNWMTRKGENGIQYCHFNKELYPLQEALINLLLEKKITNKSDLFSIGGVDYLHQVINESDTHLDKNEVNEITKMLYEQNDFFLRTYKQFVKYICSEIIKKPCYFQKIPTIRCHFPHQKGFNWSPRFHSDIILGHPPQEVNIWIPLTNEVYDTNSLLLLPLETSLNVLANFDRRFQDIPEKVQTDYNLQKHLHEYASALTMNYGNFVLFDSRCLHACQHNVENTTRISMDIRVIPVDDFKQKQLSYRGTGRRKIAFEVGEYYDNLTSEEL